MKRKISSQDLNQYQIRINFNDPNWALNYLRKCGKEVGTGTTIIPENGNLNLLPHYEGKEVHHQFLSKIDTVAEYLALGLEKSLLLQRIENFIANPNQKNVFVGTELQDPNILKGELLVSLKNIESDIKKALLKVPVSMISLIVAETIAPITPTPFPAASLPLLSPLVSLPKKYFKLLKKIKNIAKDIEHLEIKPIIEPELDKVGKALSNKDLKQAYQITDDLDGIIGNNEFTEQTLTLAEHIAIMEHLDKEPDTLKNRLKLCMKSEFWKDLFKRRKKIQGIVAFAS